MGYHVRITRERLNQQSPIPLDEWLRFIEATDEFEKVDTEPNSQVGAFNRQQHAVRVRSIPDSWLGWSEGEIWTKSPSDPLFEYMLTLAPQLRARVAGDESEFYLDAENYVYEVDGRQYSQGEWQAIHAHKSRRREIPSLKYRLLVIATGLLLGLAAAYLWPLLSR